MKATLTLALSWLLSTAAFIAFNAMTPRPLLPGFVVKVGPFIFAGWITGRITHAVGRSRWIAAGGVALISAVAWTLFAFATQPLSGGRALTLFAVSLPIHFLAGAWAWFGMWLGARRSAHDDAELEDLEHEIKDEMKR